ncbi:DNA-processing protein DprA [Marinibaculum pumilum]|uniref:DNA-processing protein DprA n=1 Tax=Marinibaculum pumilum TaxID=1766165 RepID=A0ABV7KW59_9PROT
MSRALPRARNDAARAGAGTAGQLVDWLRLALTPDVGPLTFRRLLHRYGSAAAALAAYPEWRGRGGTGGVPLPTPGQAADAIARAEGAGIRLLPGCDPAYPPLLRQIADPPPILYLAGVPNRLADPAIALVGARNASALGRRMAAGLARDLGDAGWTIVSGLARGIDTAAHEAALGTGTVAVLAGGVDIPYPRENAALYDRIRAAGGLLLSEMPPGTQPQARHFPRRNRLISGLSQGVVVVEAALRSGSLITARMALEQNRDLFAVPGSPLDPRARGCNALLKQGAALVEDAGDVLTGLPDRAALLARLPPALPPELPERRLAAAAPAPVQKPAGTDSRIPPPAPLAEGDLAGRLAGLLGPQPVHIDLLVRELGIDSGRLASLLLDLEMSGRLRRHPGNQVSLS